MAGALSPIAEDLSVTLRLGVGAGEGIPDSGDSSAQPHNHRPPYTGIGVRGSFYKNRFSRTFFGFFIILELGWSGIVEKYSTESINHFHTRQTQFRELFSRAFPKIFQDLPRCSKDVGPKLSPLTATNFQNLHFLEKRRGAQFRAISR